MHTYFIRPISGGPIKIGKAADVRSRFSGIQTGSPVLLELIAVAEGDIEKELHAALDQYRLHGEWFAPAPAVVQTAMSYAGKHTPRLRGTRHQNRITDRINDCVEFCVTNVPKVRLAKPAGRGFQIRYTDPRTGSEVRISAGTNTREQAELARASLVDQLREAISNT